MKKTPSNTKITLMKANRFILGIALLFSCLPTTAQEAGDARFAVEPNVGFASFDQMKGFELGFAYSYRMTTHVGFVAGLNMVSLFGEELTDDLNQPVIPSRNRYSFSPGVRLKMNVSERLSVEATTLAHCSFWYIYDLNPALHPGDVCVLKLFAEERVGVSCQLAPRMSLGVYYGLVYGKNDHGGSALGHNVGVGMKVNL